MKKLLVLILAILMITPCIASCNAKTDWEYIDANDELIIGITLFKPMNYYEGETLTGFETEFATEICKILGVTPKFQEIKWAAKETELNAKNIDCIWNGMTITDERKANMDISQPYMKNKQVVIVKAENATKYSDAASFKDAEIVAEAESAGEEIAKGNALFAQAKYTAVDTMAKAVMEVASGTADACIIDYITALGTIGEGTDYAGLTVVEGLSFNDEEYGIAFRKNSPETVKKVNDAINTLIENGKLEEIAAKYKIASQIIKGN